MAVRMNIQYPARMERAARPSVRTPQDRQEYRMSLHKSSGSPAWKCTYRQRCVERLKASREKFLSRFRHVEAGIASPGDSAVSKLEIASSVHDVMVEEWKQMRMENAELPQIPTLKRSASFPECTPGLVKKANWDPLYGSNDDLFSSTDVDEDIDYVLSVMDELTQELVKEEQAILAQYEQGLKFDEDALCAAIECLTTTDVICPICQKNILHQNKHIIFCACGIRLDTAQDGITMEYVRRQLEDCTSQHSALCSGIPVFSLETTLGMQNIIMNCTVCDFMYIVV